MTKTTDQNIEISSAQQLTEVSTSAGIDANISHTSSAHKVENHSKNPDILNAFDADSSRKGDYLLAQNVYTDAKPHVYDGLTSDEIIDKLADEHDGKSDSIKKETEDADQQEERDEDFLVAEVATDGLSYDSAESSGPADVDDSVVAEALEEKSDNGFLGLTKWGWAGVGLLGVGIAVSGDDSVPPPDAPSLTLDTDSI